MPSEYAIGVAARIWCEPETESIPMDTRLAAAFAEKIDEHNKPNLGLATTRQLKDEVEARGPDSPDNYRTIDQD